MLLCPLCMKSGFSSSEVLLYELVAVSIRKIFCPLCSDVVSGIDKLTIHLCSHILKCNSDPERHYELKSNTPSQGNIDHEKSNNSSSILPKENHNQVGSCMLKKRTVSNHRYDAYEESYKLQNIMLSQRNNNHDESIKLGNNVPDQRNNAHEEFYNLQNILNQGNSNHENLKLQRNMINDKTSDHNESRKLQSNTNQEQMSQKIYSSMQILHVDLNNDNIPISIIPSSNRLDRGQMDDTIITSDAIVNVQNILESQEVKNLKKNSDLFTCHKCLATFADENLLSIHIELIHNSESPIKSVSKSGSAHICLICQKSFKMKASLIIHQRVSHDKKGQKINKLEDDLENMKLNSLGSLQPGNLQKEEQLNILKHWNCDVCSKLFTTKYFLKKHKRLHTGEMPYTCSICNKSFTFQQSYHKHLLYHTDDKPHSCDHCGRSFRELSTLHNHQRIHTGEKPFSCHICGKSFRQRVSCLVHNRIHTGAKPYTCTGCLKTFRYKASERSHKCKANPPGEIIHNGSGLIEKLKLKSSYQPIIWSDQNNIEIDQKISHNENQIGSREEVSVSADLTNSEDFLFFISSPHNNAVQDG